MSAFGGKADSQLHASMSAYDPKRTSYLVSNLRPVSLAGGPKVLGFIVLECVGYMRSIG
jgi:hypothetical protein